MDKQENWLSVFSRWATTGGVVLAIANIMFLLFSTNTVSWLVH